MGAKIYITWAIWCKKPLRPQVKGILDLRARTNVLVDTTGVEKNGLKNWIIRHGVSITLRLFAGADNNSINGGGKSVKYRIKEMYSVCVCVCVCVGLMIQPDVNNKENVAPILTKFGIRCRQNHTCRFRWPRGLTRGSAAARLLGLRVRIPPGQGCLSLVIVGCCQVEVSASGWRLIERDPIEFGVSECDRETSIIRRPWQCCAVKKYIYRLVIYSTNMTVVWICKEEATTDQINIIKNTETRCTFLK